MPSVKFTIKPLASIVNNSLVLCLDYNCSHALIPVTFPSLEAAKLSLLPVSTIIPKPAIQRSTKKKSERVIIFLEVDGTSLFPSF